MTDNHKAAWALILGSVGGMLTMAIHPTSETPHLALVSGIAHSLALVSVLLLFLGTIGITYALAAADRLALAALVTLAFGCVAVMIAASVSGFIAPEVLRMMDRDIPAVAGQYRITLAALYQLNQAMSRIYSVATAAAITLWSVCSLKQGRLARGMALYGVISAPLIALLICVGHRRLNVHGMTVVMVSEVIWYVGIGVSLRRLGSVPA